MPYQIYTEDWGAFYWKTIDRLEDGFFPPTFAENYVNQKYTEDNQKSEFERLQIQLNNYKFVNLQEYFKQPRPLKNGLSVVDDSRQHQFDTLVFICQKFETKFNVKFDWSHIG